MPEDPLSSLPRANEPIVLSEAYRAMLRVLDYYYRLDSKIELGAVLGDLSTGVWTDGTPGDPAAWSLWLDSVDGKDRVTENEA